MEDRQKCQSTEQNGVKKWEEKVRNIKKNQHACSNKMISFDVDDRNCQREYSYTIVYRRRLGYFLFVGPTVTSHHKNGNILHYYRQLIEVKTIQLLTYVCTSP